MDVNGVIAVVLIVDDGGTLLVVVVEINGLLAVVE